MGELQPLIRVWIPRMYKDNGRLRYDYTHRKAGVFLNGILHELWCEQICDCPGKWPKFSDPHYWDYPRRWITYTLIGRNPPCLQKMCIPRREFSPIDLYTIGEVT